MVDDNMLLALKELDYHVQRLEHDFKFGELVAERRLEETKINDFNFRFDKLLRYLIELKALTKGESKTYTEEALKALGKTKQKVMKLAKEANFKNDDLTPLMQHMNIIIDRKRKTVEDVKFNLQDIVKTIETLKEKHTEVADVLPKIDSIMDGNYSDTEDDLLLLNEDLEQVGTYINDLRVKNKHLEEVVLQLHKKLDDIVFLLKDESELELEDFVTDPSLQRLPIDVVETIGKNLRLTREATMFESDMKDGERSILIKQHVKGGYDLFTYGTDPDIELCREAKRNGVDFVAKKGIYKVSHNTFDVVLSFLDEFTFFEDGELKLTLPEETKFNYLFNRSLPKSNAYVLFNIPYFKIPIFMRKIKSMLTIESLYKVDDEIKNVLFVCRYKQNVRSDSKTFTKALLEYDKLPHYTELNELVVSKGDLTHPKTFRPYFVDEEDILQAFERETPTFEIVEGAYRPKEKVIELNRPLQEYKEGHLPAVATIEIVNGIYDLGEEIDFPNIYSTKIVQQDVEEEKEELYKGEKVKIVSQKKKNVIVSKILLPNGEIVELLNTK